MNSASSENEAWVRTLTSKASASDKSWTTTLALSVFFGLFGADRFYLGYAVLGLLKLGTFGGFGLWWFLDMVLILINQLKDSDGGVLDSPLSRH